MGRNKDDKGENKKRNLVEIPQDLSPQEKHVNNAIGIYTKMTRTIQTVFNYMDKTLMRKMVTKMLW